MNSKYETSGLPATAQGLALIDWMLVVSITVVLLYLVFLIYQVSVKDSALSKRVSQVSNVTACHAGRSTQHADTPASLRQGQHSCAQSLKRLPLKRLQGQATDIADAAVGIRHGNNVYTLHGALLEPRVSLYRGATAIKPVLNIKFQQHDYIPDWAGLACCNRGVVS